MSGTLAEEYTRLAQDDPAAFLEKIAFSDQLRDVSSNIEFSFLEGMIKRRWAMDPARDGLNAVFNPFSGFKDPASGSLRNDAYAFVLMRHHPFEKHARDGVLKTHWERDPKRLTPAYVTEVVEHAVEVSRALDRRHVPGDDCGIPDMSEQNDFLENVALPLLRNIPAPNR